MRTRRKNGDVRATICTWEAYAHWLEADAATCMRLWAGRLAKRASRLAPVRTGRLRNSIGFSVTRRDRRITASYGTTVPYARFVEFGTNRITVGTPVKPRERWPAKKRIGKNRDATMPFLRTAWAQLGAAFVKDLTKAGGRLK